MQIAVLKYDLKRGIYFTLLSALSYSTTHLLAIFVLDRFSLFQLFFLQNLIAFIFLTPFLSVRSAHWKIHLVRSLSGSLGGCFILLALKTLNLVDVMTLNHLFPFLVAILGFWWLNEPVAKYAWLAIAFGFIGTLVILNPTWNFFHLGGIFALGSALTSAISFTAVRSLNLKGEPPERILTYLFATGIVVSFPFTVHHWVQPHLHEWTLFLLSGILAFLNQIFVVKAFKCAPAHTITPFGYASIVFAMMFNWLFLGRPMKPESIFGSFLIGVGALLICLLKQKKKQNEIISS